MGSISRPRCAPWRPGRLESGQGGLAQIFGVGLGGQGSQDAAQEARRSGTATRTRSYAHCGLEDMSANNEGKHNIFSTFAKATVFGPESGRAKRYAQRDILNMGALERIMLSMVRCEICKRGKRTLTSVNMKTLKKPWKHVHKLVHDEIQGWQRSLTSM